MKSVPIDPNEFDRNVMAIIGIEPVLDFDTEQQKTDKDGAPKWRLQVLYKAPRQRKPDVEEIGFAPPICRARPDGPTGVRRSDGSSLGEHQRLRHKLGHVSVG